MREKYRKRKRESEKMRKRKDIFSTTEFSTGTMNASVVHMKTKTEECD